MGELEDKLNSILGNPEAMGQIMALAQSLGAPASAAPQTAESAPPAPPQSPAAGADLSALVGGLMGGDGIDPRLLSVAARIMQEAGRNDDRRTALLEALRPFIREQRYAKLDKAIQIARLSHLIRIGLDALKGGDHHV